MIETTSTLTGAKARAKILTGVNKVYDTVKLTLGPEGKNALLPRTYNRGPRITNDGITVMELARQTNDPHERLAAEAFTEGSKRTNELAGDGTTGTAVISGHLINKIFLSLSEQDTPSATIEGKATARKGVRAIRKEIIEVKNQVIEEIKKASKKIKTLAELEKIATISIGQEDEKTAKIIAKMVWETARDGSGEYIDNHIDVTEGYKGEIETEVIKGMRFPAKLAHRAFLTNPERFEMVANDVAILVTNFKLDNPYQVVALLNTVKAPKIALFSPEFSPMVIKSLVETTKNGLFCYPVKCPSLRTEQLEDLAVYTGATLIDKDMGKKLENVTREDLGFAEKIIVKDTENKEDAILLGGKGDKIKRGTGTLVTERCGILKKQIGEARNELTKMSLNRRIANLSSAVGIIRVGATTNNESLFLKLKIEDGVFACKAALEEGYVRGGGLCLKNIADKMEPNILSDSLRAPYEQIQRNAGGAFEIAKDIIDPTKVVRLEVEHGISVASMLITTDISIPELREKSPAEGYEAIARAINTFAYYDAKHKGLIRENELEAEGEMKQIFEETMLMDHD